MKTFSVFLSFLFITNIIAQEPYQQNQTYTYDEVHAEYESLAKKYSDKCKLIQFGSSDYGKNIALFLINKDGVFEEGGFKNKSVLLINNAIHPGEPCGVDACVKLSKMILADDSKIPENVVIGIIPMYNVGGAHNRSCCSRSNQNGPEEYGFRGNAKNLDLNRDFIKADSKNTRTFYKIYHFLKPNIFVDTHTSNGADYQHVMTLITSQMDKMHPWLAKFTGEKLNPDLFNRMEKSSYPMVPYVHTLGRTPETGIMDYLETPRYSTGFTNLYNTIGYVTETHMLKTYEERVNSTFTFLTHMIEIMEENSEALIQLKQKVDYNTGFIENFALNWQLDTVRHDSINFLGYQAEYPKSEVTGLPRLKYNQDKPWEHKIAYYNRYIGTDSVRAPEYYIIPAAWQDVIIRLQLNGIQVEQVKNDMLLEVEVYYIDDYTTTPSPYEGHYLHRKIKLSKSIKKMSVHKGDYVVNTANVNRRFLVETLEPNAPDSYFAWNYFDPILQQKEWFSPYVFEETAKLMLEEDDELKKEFESKKKEDKDFAADGFMQLYFLYQRSPNYERTHNQYPILRYMQPFNADEIESAPTLFGF